MYALRERRQHVTQEDFEFAVAKVRTEGARRCVARVLTVWTGSEEEPRGKHVCEQTVLIAHSHSLLYLPLCHQRRGILCPKIEMYAGRRAKVGRSVVVAARSLIQLVQTPVGVLIQYGRALF
jgi:hypothetical protein